MAFSRRGHIRISTFLAAGIIGLSVFAVGNYYRAERAERKINLTYTRAAEELASSLDNIKNTLSKGLYSNSGEMMTEFATKLRADASSAKIYMAQLPTSQIDLSDAYKFLSQVGNFSSSLAGKISSGENLSDDEKQNILSLYSFAQTVSDSMWNIELQLREGYLSFKDTDELDNSADMGAGGGFADIENGFDNYPTLIYDGPFSDHIMEKEPEMLKGLGDVDSAVAEEKAFVVLNAAGADSSKMALTDSGEDGKMASYLFKDGNRTVNISKKGGLLVYMLNYRPVNAEKKAVTAEAAEEKAAEFLRNAGIPNFIKTYYEIQGGVAIFNFAGVMQVDGKDVTIYTDLIKVGVALDDGEILSADARGYIVNHYDREISSPQMSEKDAADKVSPELDIKSSKLCVIPSSGLNERFAYEFNTTADDGKNILVYINADTGKEEQILIVQITGNGSLAV